MPLISSQGTIAGDCTILGVGAESYVTGTAAGSSTLSGIGHWLAAVAGNVFGSSTIAGVGASSFVTGTIAGSATASGISGGGLLINQIVWIDCGSSIIVYTQGDGTAVASAFTTDTVLTRDGNIVGCGSLKAGDFVTVTEDEDSGLATLITALHRYYSPEEF
jgi:hypothetical protein